MESVDVRLEIPIDLASEVVSTSRVQAALRAAPEASIQSIAETGDGEHGYRDFGATLLVIAGTATAAAAVEGIFNLVTTIIEQVSESRRQRREHQHEVERLTLIINGQRRELDADQPAEELHRMVDELRESTADGQGT
jgi:hypothetical protein